ncbi:MAG: biotin/lipoyl-binding protein [Firmicutes bacterium]|nr:biotin/lipoyl-binding protein [Bacillota bacterium]
MENYIITVNGVSYEVQVEKAGETASPAPRAAAPKAAPKAAAAPAAPKAAPAAAGSVKITAGAAGKIFKIAAAAGTAVKAGDTVIILEAMKMEIPQVAPQDGVVASINVTEGQMVEAGEVIATLK